MNKVIFHDRKISRLFPALDESLQLMKDGIFAELKYELPHLMRQKRYKYHCFSHFVCGIHFEFNLLHNFFIFFVPLMRKILQFGIYTSPLNKRSHKFRMSHIFFNITRNFLFYFVLLSKDLNQLFICELALVQIKRFSFIILNNPNLIQIDTFIFFFKHS